MRKPKLKKRGVKPGTKRGRYKRVKSISVSKYADRILKPMTEKFMEATKASYTPAPLSLCGQLEDAILLLETRISNAVAKINSLM